MASPIVDEPPATRVLIVERLSIFRELLLSVLAGEPMRVVASAASSPREIVSAVRTVRPHLLLLGAGSDGDADTVRRIMVEVPTPVVVIAFGPVEAAPRDGTHLLQAGAVALAVMPSHHSLPGYRQAADELRATVRAMVSVKVVRQSAGRSSPAQIPPVPTASDVRRSPRRVVAIAASTGGPTALLAVLSTLPADFPVPILLVQHIASGFVESFGHWLASSVPQKVVLAGNGVPLASGTIYVGPDDRQFGVALQAGRAVVRLSRDRPVDGFRPSGSYLFQSVARVFGRDAVGIILTGMGIDGTGGLRAIREAGGYVLAQDEQSSAVFGMPRAAIAAGIVDEVHPASDIGRRLVELVGVRAGPSRPGP